MAGLTELRTSRLTLRPAIESDTDRFWALWTDPDVRRYLWDDQIIPRERAAELVLASERTAASGLGLWTLWLAATEEFVGCVGLYAVAGTAEAAEPLVALAPTHWGRGFASEALQAVLRHAFGTLGLARLEATVDLPNAASHRLVRRLGFTPIGEAPGPRYLLVCYALDAPV